MQTIIDRYAVIESPLKNSPAGATHPYGGNCVVLKVRGFNPPTPHAYKAGLRFFGMMKRPLLIQPLGGIAKNTRHLI